MAQCLRRWFIDDDLPVAPPTGLNVEEEYWTKLFLTPQYRLWVSRPFADDSEQTSLLVGNPVEDYWPSWAIRAQQIPWLSHPFLDDSEQTSLLVGNPDEDYWPAWATRIQQVPWDARQFARDDDWVPEPVVFGVDEDYYSVTYAQPLVWRVQPKFDDSDQPPLLVGNPDEDYWFQRTTFKQPLLWSVRPVTDEDLIVSVPAPEAARLRMLMGLGL